MFFKFVLNNIPRIWLIKMSLYFRPLFSFYYKGDRFTDPINEKSYRKFIPYGYQRQRKNALSPGTFSLERHRFLWLYLKRHSDFFDEKEKKLLHISPEQCFNKIFKTQKNLNYSTLDLNSPLADIKANVCNLPFKGDTFDVIFCNHVLEHISDDKSALEELYRVLKVGAWSIFQVPQDSGREKTYENPDILNPKDRTKHFGQYDHVRIYGMDYFSRLEGVGFEVEQFELTKHFTEEEIKKYGLIKDEILPICRKN